MKELALKIPDQLEGSQIKEMIARFLFKNSAITAEEAAVMAEVEVSTFLSRNRQSEEGVGNPEDDQLADNLPAYLASVKLIRSHVSIENMKAEQDYRPINRADFFAKAKTINIEEPLEELFEMLD